MLKQRFLLLLACALLSNITNAYDRVTGAAFASRSEVIAQNGMVASSQPLATQVGLDILKAGGNAIDAAIAVNAMLGLVEPTGCGIGGDLFALVWDARSKKLYGLNASGRSPKSLSLATLRAQGDSIPPYGPLPVSVPGAVDGWFELHKRFGQLAMRDILQPSIDYAESGFPVSELIAFYMQRSAAFLQPYPGFSEVFMPQGKMPAKGELFRNPALARAYKVLAAKGREGFYAGEIADEIDRYMRANGGYLRKQDLLDHHSDWVDPVSSDYRGHQVWELPPNGQGIAALQILNIMEQYDVHALGQQSDAFVHTFVEAKKLAFADRAHYYADPDFNNLPVAQLISKDYARKRKALIGPRASRQDHAGPVTGDTVYLTTADKEGNMVSLIQSNFRGMGSGMTVAKYGFVLQDRGQLFTLQDGHANQYAPGKRPFHTIIPAFVTKDGKPWLSFGVMGGATQPQMHAQIIMNLVDFGMNLQEAGDAPRILHSGSSQPTGEIMRDGGYISLEQGFPLETRQALQRRGHILRDAIGAFGGYQAILRDPDSGVYYGASESRKDGAAAGY